MRTHRFYADVYDFFPLTVIKHLTFTSKRKEEALTISLFLYSSNSHFLSVNESYKLLIKIFQNCPFVHSTHSYLVNALDIIVIIASFFLRMERQVFSVVAYVVGPISAPPFFPQPPGSQGYTNPLLAN